MQDRINRCVKSHEVLPCNWAEIYLVDWKKYTQENLKIHQIPQLHPETGETIGSICFYNKNTLPIVVDAFGENALHITKKKRSKQCECTVYPHGCNTDEWVLFIEMKYAESEYAALSTKENYPQKMIQQITETVEFFRNKGIIQPEKEVYALISFPNLLSAFNSSFLSTNTITNIYLDKGIILRTGNGVEIIDKKEINLLSN